MNALRASHFHIGRMAGMQISNEPNKCGQLCNGLQLNGEKTQCFSMAFYFSSLFKASDHSLYWLSICVIHLWNDPDNPISPITPPPHSVKCITCNSSYIELSVTGEAGQTDRSSKTGLLLADSSEIRGSRGTQHTALSNALHKHWLNNTEGTRRPSSWSCCDARLNIPYSCADTNYMRLLNCLLCLNYNTI